MYVGFVHATQLTESFNGGVAILENDAAERQIIAHPGQFRGWQSIVMRQVRFRVEDMSQVDNGVARDGERELGLVGGDSVDADHHECGYIENRRQSRKPRLIGVLRTIVCKHRIGQMTFEQLRRPAFPVAKKGGKFDELSAIEVTAQQLRRCRRRSGARIEKRNVQFAPGECLIQNREIPDDYSQKSEAHARFKYRQGSAGPCFGDNIAEAESKKRRAAEIKISEETDGPVRHLHRRAERAMQGCETENQTRSPKTQQKEQ